MVIGTACAYSPSINSDVNQAKPKGDRCFAGNVAPMTTLADYCDIISPKELSRE